MDSKTAFALATNLMLGGVLVCAWYLGKDGTISTAIIAMIGLISGSILGFKLAEKAV